MENNYLIIVVFSFPHFSIYDIFYTLENTRSFNERATHFKKGDINDLNKYRDISLLSNLGKLFTAVHNQRLIKWSQNNDIITDAQFGFRPGYGTVDAIFILHSIISHTLAKTKRLYCAFVDFKMAFDSIDRCKLWYKIAKIGI